MLKRHKFNEKKLLHKIGKHWCVVSIAMLGLIGGTTMYQQQIHADNVQNNISQEEEMNQVQPHTVSKGAIKAVNSASIAVRYDWQATGSYLESSNVKANSNAYNTLNQANGIIRSDGQPLREDYGEMISDNSSQEANDLAYNANSIASSAASTANNDLGGILPPIDYEKAQASQFDRENGYDDNTDMGPEAPDNYDINNYTPSENSESGVYSNDFITSRNIINSDADTVHSYFNQDDLNDNDDVENEIEEDSEGIDEASEAQDPTDNNYAVSLANSYKDDAVSVMSSSVSNVNSTFDDDSMAISNDVSQMDSDENQVISIEDSLIDENISVTSQDTTYYNLSSVVDQDNYSMSSLYDINSEGYDSESGYTSSEATSVADSLRDDADSATYDGNDYTSQLTSYANFVDSYNNSISDSSESKSSADHSEASVKHHRSTHKRTVNHHQKRVRRNRNQKRKSHVKWHRGTPKALGHSSGWISGYKRVSRFKVGHKIIRYERVVSSTLGGNKGFDPIFINYTKHHHYVNNGNDISYNIGNHPMYKALGHRRYEIVCGGSYAHPIAKAQIKMIIKIYNHHHIRISRLGRLNGSYYRINFNRYMHRFWGNF